MSERGTVAVVGAGIAGLTAAYVLQREHDVTLFEANNRLGGHAHTHDLPGAGGGTIHVDTGFIVHNTRTYPNLLRLFRELDVATQDAEMSMSVRCERTGLEYAGAHGLGGLFPHTSNLANPRYLRMLGEVARFHRHARRVLDDERAGDVTLGQFLAVGGYTPFFVEYFMIPVVSCVWSAGGQVTLGYPARYLFMFLHHHGMLSIGDSPRWRTVTGGSQRYVERVARALTSVRCGARVRAIARTAEGVEVRDDADAAHRFDKVVVATHPDQALAALAAPTEAERAVLGAFRYSRNEVWLHSDTSVLPRRPRAKASWNHVVTAPRPGVDSSPVLVSYDMNRLQRLAEPEIFVVTLNAEGWVDESRVIARMSYEHPTYTPESVAAQRRLPGLNDGTIAFAGAYHGWGFHEDGCAAGMRAARSLGTSW